MGLTFEVPGDPRGKGRPRVTENGTYTDSETKAYENKIIWYYRQAFGGFRWPDGAYIRVKVIAYYSIPKRATKSALAAMQAGNILPTRKPDIDNVLKIVLDALNGVAYKDDSRVVCVEAQKVFSHTPKIVIEIQGSE